MDIWVVFYFLAIMNNAAENLDGKVFLWTHVFYSLGTHLGVEWMDNMITKKILMTQMTTMVWSLT